MCTHWTATIQPHVVLFFTPELSALLLTIDLIMTETFLYFSVLSMFFFDVSDSSLLQTENRAQFLRYKF